MIPFVRAAYTDGVIETWLPLRSGLRADGLSEDHPIGRGWRKHGLVRLLVMVVASGVALAAFVGVLIVTDQGTFVTSSVGGPVMMMVVAVLGYLGLLAWERRGATEFRGLRGLGVGILWGAALMTASVGLVFVAQGISFEGLNPSYATFARDLLVMGICAAVAEEIVCRGVLFRLTEHWVGTWGAVALSSLLFGLAHLGNPKATLVGVLAIAVEAGVLFAVLYALTRSLWVVIGVHFAWNMMQGPLFGIVVSGSSARGSGFLVSRPTGFDLISGGAFGVEASLVTVLLLSAVSVWLIREMRRRGLAVSPSWVRKRAERTFVAASLA